MPDPLAPLRRALPAFLPRRVLLAMRRDLTVANLTERLASVYGDRVAFRLEERSALARKRELTFNDVDRVVTRLATVLAKEGLPLGELVAVVPSNGIDFLLTFLAVVRAGGIAVPVLVLTARGSWSDKVRGIDGGADDYLTKPFRMEELLARLRALIRRSSGQLMPELRSGAVALDPRTSQVTLDGQPVKLTSHELRVLSYLMHHRGRVVSQSELTEHIYAQTFDRDSNTVEVFIARLRRKLGSATIETVRGLGYRIRMES